MSTAPQKADDRRPGGTPFYTAKSCPKCDTALQYYDPTGTWFDEFECPTCRDGVYLDWPSAELDTLRRAIYNDELIDWDASNYIEEEESK